MIKPFVQYRIFKQSDGTFVTTFDAKVYSNLIEARRSLSSLRNRLRSARVQPKWLIETDVYEGSGTDAGREMQESVCRSEAVKN